LLVVSGGVGVFGPSEAEVGAAPARELGVDSTVLVLEADSHSTRENARFTATLLRGRGLHCVRVVSDPYHLARAKWAFQREQFEVEKHPVLNAPRHRSLILRLWWTAREVPAFIKMVVTEPRRERLFSDVSSMGRGSA
jgi:uncharacterized SAM-binding protein YcdF (DUF218 family)